MDKKDYHHMKSIFHCEIYESNLNMFFLLIFYLLIKLKQFRFVKTWLCYISMYYLANVTYFSLYVNIQ